MKKAFRPGGLLVARDPDVAQLRRPFPRRGPADAFARNKKLGRGVNVIGYDPIWKHRGQGRFKAGHFREIRKAGFDHVRINLHPFRDNRGGQEGKLRDEYLRALDWAVERHSAMSSR